MKNYTLFYIALLVITLFISGCAIEKSTGNPNADLTIYTSVYPIQYAVERVGGDTVNTASVFPSGVDAHTYEPTSKEMANIAKGDAFIYIGDGMEGFTDSMADALASQEVELIELHEHEELFTSTHEEHDHEESSAEHDGHQHGDYDPHFWIDPLRMLEMAQIVETKLSELNPEKSDLYQENFQNLKEDLLSLDQEFMDTLEAKTNKHILVAHAAFGYWEERYGIEQIAINGMTSSSEPSQKELTEIIELAKGHHLQYIIFEQNGSSHVSEIIQEQIGAEALLIHNLSVLTETDINENKDYLSLMRENLQVLKTAIN